MILSVRTSPNPHMLPCCLQLFCQSLFRPIIHLPFSFHHFSCNSPTILHNSSNWHGSFHWFSLLLNEIKRFVPLSGVFFSRTWWGIGSCNLSSIRGYFPLNLAKPAQMANPVFTHISHVIVLQPGAHSWHLALPPVREGKHCFRS